MSEYRLELLCLTPPPAPSPAPPPPQPQPQQQQQQQQEEEGEAASGSGPQQQGAASSEPPPREQQEQQQQPLGWPDWTTVYLGPDLSTRVHGLVPGCRYALRCSALNAAGWGAHSAEERFSTSLAPPGPPEAVEASLVSLGGGGEQPGVQLRWQAPLACGSQAAPASYEVHAVPVVGPGSHGHELRQTVGRAVTSYTWVAGELQAGTRYALRVRAAGMEGAGHGPWSEPAVELLMPGTSSSCLAGAAGGGAMLLRGDRGVTDSADSMSATSGGVGEGGAGAAPHHPHHPQQLLSAVSALKQQQQQAAGNGAVAAAAGGRGANGKKAAAAGAGAAAAAGAKKQRGGGGAGRAASVSAPATRGPQLAAGQGEHALDDCDAVSVTSHATSVATTSAASGGVFARLLGSSTSSAAQQQQQAASAGAAQVDKQQQQQQQHRNRVNTSKLQVVAVQKRPKAPLQLGKELRQLMSAHGLKKAHKAASKACGRLWQRYRWQLLALVAVALVAWLVQWAMAAHAQALAASSAAPRHGGAPTANGMPAAGHHQQQQQHDAAWAAQQQRQQQQQRHQATQPPRHRGVQQRSAPR